MTRKRKAQKLGKEIRKATGIKLPVAMRAAKFIIQNRAFELKYAEITRPFVRSLPFKCGWECCGESGNMEIFGPKGTFQVKHAQG